MSELSYLTPDDRTAEKAALFDELLMALEAVAAGIWRHKRDNTCGLAGGASVVHLVEAAIAKAKEI